MSYASFVSKFFSPYLSPRVLSIAFFAFPYGMTFFLVVSTPQVWLKELGIDHTTIGLFALVSLPYVAKFLWAPFIDVIRIPFLQKLGQRRSWLILIHGLLVVGFILLGFSNPAQNHLIYTGCIALALSILAATQDIIVDAYRIEILNKDQTGPGISMLILGYRIGSIIAKAGPLYLAHSFSWPIAYTVMGLLILVGLIATLLNPEPMRPQNSSLSLQDSIVLPFREVLGRSSFWPLVILFVIFYRFGDAMINNMASTFYLEMGFGKTQIGTVTGLFGIGATIVGGFLGGTFIRKLSIYRGLFWTAFFHSCAHLMFLKLSYSKGNLAIFYATVALENISGGMTTAVFFVYLSRLCKLEFAATQFALFTSLWSLATPLASFSGWVVDTLHQNWTLFFLLSALASLPGLFLTTRLSRYPLGNHGASTQKI